LKPAKECVTTHLPNGLALKMDGAEAGHRYSTIIVNIYAVMCRRAWGLRRSCGVSLGEAVSSADLGGSSK
jgi:hypothetical protein